MQHIWSLITQAGSLWIAWTQAYVLKGRSIWQVPRSQNTSWHWRKLLQMRSEAFQFVERRNGAESWKFPGEKYSIVAVWNEIRPRQSKTEWH